MKELSRGRVFAAAFITAFLVTGFASAQVPVFPTEIKARMPLDAKIARLGHVVNLYYCGELEVLREQFIEPWIREAVSMAGHDFPKEFYLSVAFSTVWGQPETDIVDDEDRVLKTCFRPSNLLPMVRVVYTAERREAEGRSRLVLRNVQPFSLTLAGKTSLYEFFLDDGHTTLQSSYVSTPVENPAVTNLAGFLQPLTTGVVPVFAAVALVGGEVDRVHASVSHVKLPHKRATIVVNDVVGAKKREFTLTNSPPTRVNFGAIVGGLVGRGGDPRVKVDSNIPSLNDVKGLTTMSVVNWIPFPDEPGAQNRPFIGRLRGFAGAVLTPEVGLSVGVGVRLASTVSLVVGYIPVLRVDTLRQGDVLGETVGDVKQPTTSGRATSAFIALEFDLWR